MTVKEFFSKKNIAKRDPFAGIEIKQTITMSEYKEVLERTIMLIIDEKGDYLPLIKEFAFRMSIMVVYMGLDASSLPKTDDLFGMVMCTPIYDNFMTKLDYPKQVELLRGGIDEMTDYIISNNTALNNLITRINDLFATLGNEEAIMSIIRNIAVELIDKAEQDSNDLSGDDKNAES